MEVPPRSPRRREVPCQVLPPGSVPRKGGGAKHGDCWVLPCAPQAPTSWPALPKAPLLYGSGRSFSDKHDSRAAETEATKTRAWEADTRSSAQPESGNTVPLSFLHFIYELRDYFAEYFCLQIPPSTFCVTACDPLKSTPTPSGVPHPVLRGILGYHCWCYGVWKVLIQHLRD